MHANASDVDDLLVHQQCNHLEVSLLPKIISIKCNVTQVLRTN